MIRSKSSILAIGLAAASLLLASCSGDDKSTTVASEGAPLTSSTAPNSATSSSTPTAETAGGANPQPDNMQGIVLCRIEPSGSVIRVINPDDGSEEWKATIPSAVEGVDLGSCPEFEGGRLSPDFRYLGIALPMTDGGTHAGIHDLTTGEVTDVSGLAEPDPDAFSQQAIQDSPPVFSTPTEYFWNRDPLDSSTSGRVFGGSTTSDVVKDIAPQQDVAGDPSIRLGAQGGFVYGSLQRSARVSSPEVDAFIYVDRVCSNMQPGLVLRATHERCPEVLGPPINFEADVVAMLSADSYLYRSAKVVQLNPQSGDGASYLQEASTRSLVTATTRSVQAVALSSSGTKVLLIVDGELWWVPSDADNAEPTKVPNFSLSSSVLGWLD